MTDLKEWCSNLRRNLLKFSNVFLNIAIGVAALSLITIGVLAATLWKEYFSVFQQTISGVPYAFIGMGFVLIAVAVIGLTGTMMENKILLILNAVLVSILVLLEIASAITAGAYKAQVNEMVRIGLKNLTVSFPQSMDVLQDKFSCCAVNGPNDYSNSSLPNSCCAGPQTCVLEKAYQQGCLQVIYGNCINQINIAIPVVLVVAIIHSIIVFVSIRFSYVAQPYEKVE